MIRSFEFLANRFVLIMSLNLPFEFLANRFVLKFLPTPKLYSAL